MDAFMDAYKRLPTYLLSKQKYNYFKKADQNS